MSKNNPQPIGNTFLFSFVDAVNAKGQFEREPTATGIILQASADDSASKPRWAKVLVVGPGCTMLKPGMQVLLPNLRWTEGFKVNEQFWWKSDESEVVATRESGSLAFTPVGDWVFFTKRPLQQPKTSIEGMVFDNFDYASPTGTILSKGPRSVIEDEATILFYRDVNFKNTFELNGQKISFIQDEDIIVTASED